MADVLPIVAYVAGPYRDPRGPFYIRENIRRAEAVALDLWQQGVPALCPHLNTALFDGAAPDEVWLAGDLVMLARCDVVVLTEDWSRSAGTRAEARFAEQSGIPVFVWESPELQDWISEKRREVRDGG